MSIFAKYLQYYANRGSGNTGENIFWTGKCFGREIKKLGGKNVEVKNRAVNCVGDLGFLYKINYSLRTALKILVPVLTFKAFNESKYYDKIFKFPWDEFMDADQTFAIDATVYSERYSHSQFMTLKMKDAIDYFVANHRKRPSIDTKIRYQIPPSYRSRTGYYFYG
jgi:putative N6-adenine-specific DNA methylase